MVRKVIGAKPNSLESLFGGLIRFTMHSKTVDGVGPDGSESEGIASLHFWKSLTVPLSGRI
jgi:hypothetical protein